MNSYHNSIQKTKDNVVEVLLFHNNVMEHTCLFFRSVTTEMILIRNI